MTTSVFDLFKPGGGSSSSPVSDIKEIYTETSLGGLAATPSSAETSWTWPQTG